MDFLNIADDLRQFEASCFLKLKMPKQDAPNVWLVTIDTSNRLYRFLGWRGNILWQITDWDYEEVQLRDFTGHGQNLEFPTAKFPTPESKIVEVLRFVKQYSSAEVFWMTLRNTAALKNIKLSKAEVRSIHLRGAKAFLEQPLEEMKRIYSSTQLYD